MNTVFDVSRTSSVRIATKSILPLVTASSADCSRQILFQVQRLPLILFLAIWQSGSVSIVTGQEFFRSSLPVSNIAFIAINDVENGKTSDGETEKVADKRTDDEKKIPVNLDDQAINVANDRVRVALQDMTEVSFEDVPLRDCLEYLSDLHRIQIELDPVAAEKLGDVDSLSVSLTAYAMSLADGLMIMLSPLGLSYLADEGKMIITTRDEVRRRGAVVPMEFSEVLSKLSKYPSVPWDSVLRGQEKDPLARMIAEITLALDDTDDVTRLYAARALHRLARSTRFVKTSVPKLKTLTTSNNPQLRKAAYFALAAIGHSDFPTLPYLIEAWPKDEVVRADWFLLIREYDEQVYQELEKLYPNSEATFRRAIIQSIRYREISAEKLLLSGLADDDEIARRSALISVRDLFLSSGVLSDDLIASLQRIRTGPNPQERLDVAMLFLWIDDKTDDSLDFVMLSIANGRPDERTQTLARLGASIPVRSNPHRLQGLGSRIIQRLNTQVDSGNEEMRLASLMALAGLQLHGPYAIFEYSWGPIHEGLQTRLSINDQLPKFGEPLQLEIEIRNEGNVDLTLDGWTNPLIGSLRIVDPNLKESPEIEVTLSSDALPGKTIPKRLERSFKLDFETTIDPKYFSSATTGPFLLQIRGANFPASNVLTVKFAEVQNNN